MGGDDLVYFVPGVQEEVQIMVHVNGGSPQASDALVITDLDDDGNPVPLGADDFVVVAQSRNADAGVVLVYESSVPVPGVDYENVEVVVPNVDSGDNLLILGPDVYEQNEYLQTAAYIGSGETLNVENLAIVPNGQQFAGVPGDQDYFRFVAETTGTMDFQVYFRMHEGLLPADGDLNIEVLDGEGTIVGGDGNFGTADTTRDARVRIPVVAGQTYYLHVFGANDEVVNGYDLTVVNQAPPVPYGIELSDLPVDPDYDCSGDPISGNSDTGRSHFDNVTCDASPGIIVRLDDGILLHDLPGNSEGDSPPDEVIEIPFNPSEAAEMADPGYRVAIFVEGDPQQPGVGPQTVVGYAQMGAEEGVYLFDFNNAIVPDAEILTDGSHFISARVEIIDPADPNQHGYGARSDALEIVVDTIAPEVSLFEVVDEDSCEFAWEGVTNDTTPSFYGYAEANALMRFYLDMNDDGEIQVDEDFLLGETVAIPTDGNNQFPGGFFEFTSPVDLYDEDLGLPEDAPRIVLASAEDLAGNVYFGDQDLELAAFVDAAGPQITDVYVTSDPDYDLFAPKPTTDGPTPLVDRLTIEVQDFPARLAPDFLYPALVESIAEHPGHYHLVGDANGIIPIAAINYVDLQIEDGEIATARITLRFFEPLPDDRFTLTISDALVDPACNHLDGESNADEPQEDPLFPTGDGVPGGDFVARFTVDTRPELGVWAAGNIWVDTNGNFTFDPQNLDFTNRDIVYQMGYTSDDVFAGNFAELQSDTADGFDKLAVYGYVGDAWRWLVDTDNDGVPNVQQEDPLAANGLPVAGRFDISSDNGDEVGVFTGDTWYFDANHDFRLDAGTALPTDMRGYPLVGDFDGDGLDDLGTWSDDTFQVDLANGSLRGWDGVADATFRFGSIGVRQRPVAADMDQDGFDDFGLWMPDRTGALPRESGEWNFLVSDGASVLERIEVDPITGENVVHYTPVPFGPDMFAQFGDDYALPVVGNFDPPVTGGSGQTGGNLHTNLTEPLDVNDDGFISPIDALIPINYLNFRGSERLEGAAQGQPYLDVNMDGFISPIDPLMVVNYLNFHAAGDGEGETVWAATSGDFGQDVVVTDTTTVTAEVLAGGLLSDTPKARALGVRSIVHGDERADVSGLQGVSLTVGHLPFDISDLRLSSVDDELVREMLESLEDQDLLKSLSLDDLLGELALHLGDEELEAIDSIFSDWDRD
jgi:hypothetical protein